MLDIIPKLESGVIKALLTSFAVLISTFGTVFFNIDAVKFMDKANLLIGATVAFVALAAPLVWAYRARVNKPNPPLSVKALEKRVELVDSGKLKTINTIEESSKLR